MSGLVISYLLVREHCLPATLPWMISCLVCFVAPSTWGLPSAGGSAQQVLHPTTGGTIRPTKILLLCCTAHASASPEPCPHSPMFPRPQPHFQCVPTAGMCPCFDSLFLLLSTQHPLPNSPPTGNVCPARAQRTTELSRLQPQIYPLIEKPPKSITLDCTPSLQSTLHNKAIAVNSTTPNVICIVLNEQHWSHKSGCQYI